MGGQGVRNSFRAGAVLLALALPAGAVAETIKVKNQKDSGKGSLRKALADAEDGDRVKVPAGLYKLKTGALVIDTDIEVIGAGSKNTVLDGQKDSNVVSVGMTAGPVELAKLAITGGKSPQAAGILNLGDLTLNRVLVTKNLATIGGGGIATGGTLRVVRTEITRNKVKNTTGRSFGAGISMDSGTGTLTIERSSITKNKSISTVDDAFAGGIYFGAGEDATDLVIDRSSIAGNVATGAGRGYGGAIFFQNSVSGGAVVNLQIIRSTISGNRALGDGDLGLGGGVYFAPVATGASSSSSFVLENSTVANNLAEAEAGDGWGGGLILQPAVNTGGSAPQTITNSTIAGNEATGAAGLGGAIYSEPGSPLPTVANSLVADNAAATGDGCSQELSSLEGNLERGTTCGFDEPDDITPSNPKLQKLTDNGGPTQTMALHPNSPAVDSGQTDNCLPVDQRGIGRPEGAFCDIGAFELED